MCLGLSAIAASPHATATFRDNGLALRSFSDHGPALRSLSDNGPTLRSFSDHGPTLRSFSDRGPTLRSFSDRGPTLRSFSEGGQFSAGVSLVEVYATVTDARGEPVAGLPQDAFSVSEDGAVQVVSAFAAGDVPLSLAVGLDRSFSVPRPQLLAITRATKAFLDELRPADRTLLLAIGSRPEVLAPLGASRDEIRQALDALDSWGTTPLHDAAIAAIDAIAATSGRRALILFSDGADRYSEASAADVVRHAKARDVIVYPIAIGRQRPPLFAEIAAATGGRSFHAVEASSLRTALTAIARELRAQYLLGYAPTAAADVGPRWRTIQVRVDRPDVRVRFREGYFAR
jgi:Ca-activated chloride channel homolog